MLRSKRKSREDDVLGRSILGSGSGNAPGETRVNTSMMQQIETIFDTNSAVASCRSVLHGQLFSGGIVLKREGKEVDLKPAFRAHLDEVWLAFAADVCNSFLKWGFVVVAYEEDSVSTLALQKGKRKRPGGPIHNRIPIVPSLETHTVAFAPTGRGYNREYYVYSNSPSQGMRVDPEVRVIVHQKPDGQGNVNSPLATVLEQGLFISSLTSLAVVAETTLARPRIWTQMRRKNESAGLDPASLFFDSESRDVQASRDVEANEVQAQNLANQWRLLKVINQLQTRGPSEQGSSEHDTHSFSGAGKQAGRPKHVPPEIAPSLFCLPREQEVAPSNGQLPSARGDLENLSRLSIEQFAAAFGVPADLMFSGRYASKSTAQLALLNSTTSQLAKAISLVLTTCYRVRTVASSPPPHLCKSDTACSRPRWCAFWHVVPTSASST